MKSVIAEKPGTARSIAKVITTIRPGLPPLGAAGRGNEERKAVRLGAVQEPAGET